MSEHRKLWAPRNLVACVVRTATTSREREKVLAFQTATYSALGLLPEFPNGSPYRDKWVEDSVYFYIEDMSANVVASCRLIMPEHTGGPFFEYAELHPAAEIGMRKLRRDERCEIGGFALPRGRDSITAAAHLVRAALQFSIQRQRYSWVAMINPHTYKLFTTRFGAEFVHLGELQEMRPADVDVRHLAQPVEFDLLHYLATGRAVSNTMHDFMTAGMVIDLREPVTVF